MTAGPMTAGLRRLLVALAFVALLGTGALEAVTRSGAAAAALSSAVGGATTGVGRQGGAPPRTEAPVAPGAVGVRASLLAPAPAPPGSTDGPPAGSDPLVAPHLVAHPTARPPTSALTGRPAGAPGSRAPPVPAGTDASLPARP